MIDLDGIQKWLTRIQHEVNQDDFEAAHSMEDRLHRAVLEAIIEGAENPKELAAKALESRKIRFERYFA